MQDAADLVRGLAVLHEQASGLAEEMRPYMGKWVAIRHDKVIASGESVAAVIGQLRELNLAAHMMLRVPVDGAADPGKGAGWYGW